MNGNIMILPIVEPSSTQELRIDSSDIEILEEIRKQNSDEDYSEELLPQPMTIFSSTDIRSWEEQYHSKEELIIPDLINPSIIKGLSNDNSSIKTKLTEEVIDIEKEITQTMQSQPLYVDKSAMVVNTIQKYTVSKVITSVNKKKKNILNQKRNSNMKVKEISVNQFPNEKAKIFIRTSTKDLTRGSEEFYQPPNKKILAAKTKVRSVTSTNKYITKSPKQGMTPQYICTNSNLTMSHEDIKKDIIGYCRMCALYQEFSMAHYLCKKCNMNLHYKCQKCEKLFFSWPKIMHHIIVQTRAVPKNVYKCKYCSFTSFDNSSVRKHITLAHNEIILS